MGTVYIHYGNDHFDPCCCGRIRNGSLKPKPLGGFWASREGDEYGWDVWCRQEEYHLDRLKKSFRFLLSEDSHVLELSSEDDLLPLPKKKPWKPKDLAWMDQLQPDEHPTQEQIEEWFRPNFCMLDFEKLVKSGIDAIEMFNASSFMHSLQGWDCNSILIMNPKIVREI